MALLSDDEVFGGGQILSDDDVFGAPAAPARPVSAENPIDLGSAADAMSGTAPSALAAAGAGAPVARRGSILDQPAPRGDMPPVTPAPPRPISREDDVLSATLGRPSARQLAVSQSANPKVAAERLAAVGAHVDRDAAIRVAKDQSKPGDYEKLGGLGDAFVAYKKIAPATLKMLSALASIAPGIDLEDFSQRMEAATRGMDETTSTEFRARSREMGQLIQDPDASPITMLGFLLSNPSYAVNVAIPEIGSLLIGAGSGAAAGKVFDVVSRARAPLAMRAAGAQAEIAKIRDAVATAGAIGGEAALGAGGVYQDILTKTGSVTDAANGAALAMFGYLGLGKLTSGGAEGLIARRGAGGAIARRGPSESNAIAALRTGASEFAQEAGQSLVESAGGALGKWEPIDPNAAAKQAVVEGAAGFAIGAPIGALTGRRLSVSDAVAREIGSVDLAPVGEIMPAPRVPRVEDMPTRPLTQDEIARMAPAPEDGVSQREAGLPPHPAERSGVGAAIGVANVPRGTLADMAAQRLRGEDGSGVQPSADQEQPVGVVATGGEARSYPRGQGAAVDLSVSDALVQAKNESVSARTDQFSPERVRSRAVAADADPSDKSLSVLGATDPFKTAGEAVTWAARFGISGGVSPVQIAGGWVLSPKARTAGRGTLAEDAAEVGRLNEALRDRGWSDASGKPLSVTVAEDVSPLATSVQGAVEAAFGVRVIPIRGFPANGVQYGRRAYVNLDKLRNPSALIAVTGHESFHWLEVNEPELAGKFASAVSAYMREDAVERLRTDENRTLLPGERSLSKRRAKSEVLANLSGAMWVDSRFWQRVYDLDQGSTFRRVMYQFMAQASKLAKVLTGTAFDANRYVANVEAVREAAARVWAERAQSRRRGPPIRRGPVRTAKTAGRQSPATSGEPYGQEWQGRREGRREEVLTPPAAGRDAAAAGPALKRAEDERLPGETDKQFAKRVIDKRESPKSLPEEYGRYFDMPDGTLIVPLGRLRSTKTDAENAMGSGIGPKRMAAAAAGEIGRRDPVTVVPSATVPGSYEIIEGNGTYASVKAYGWKSVPVVVEERAVDADAWVEFKDSLGIQRHEMPQVPGKKVAGWLAFLAERGIGHNNETIRASSLKPTQAQYSPAKVEAAKTKAEGKGLRRLLASSDGFVMDGHHRWKAMLDLGRDVDVIRMQAPARELLPMFWEYEGTEVNDESLDDVSMPPADLSDAYRREIETYSAEARPTIGDAVTDRAVSVLRRVAPPAKAIVPEPDRERITKIVEPVLADAARAHAGFKRELEAIASNVGGTAVVPGVKALQRSVDKMYADEVSSRKPTERWMLKDSLRATIVVDNESMVPAAVAAVMKRYRITRVKNRFEEPTAAGYRDMLLNVEVPGVGEGEIQINIPEMISVKELGHLMFAIERASPPGPTRTLMVQEQRKLYESAYAAAQRRRGLATRSSNSALDLTSTPSRATRPTSNGVPVIADQASSPSAESRTGMSSTSTILQPGRASENAFQSNAISGTSGDSVPPNSVSAMAAARAAISLSRPTYVWRPVINGKAIESWAKSKGVESVVPASKMHVTLTYSNLPVDRTKVAAKRGAIAIGGVKGRKIVRFSNGAIVMTLESPELQSRWRELIDAGASWGFGRYDGAYKPHITLSYEDQDLDISTIKPYDGPVLLGDEKVEVLKTWFGERVGAEIKKAKKPKALGILIGDGFDEQQLLDAGQQEPEVARRVAGGPVGVAPEEGSQGAAQTLPLEGEGRTRIIAARVAAQRARKAEESRLKREANAAAKAAMAAEAARAMSRANPFEDDYAGLEGRVLRMEAFIEDTGQTAVFNMPAAAYMRELDSRTKVAQDLRRCLG